MKERKTLPTQALQLSPAARLCVGDQQELAKAHGETERDLQQAVRLVLRLESSSPLTNGQSAMKVPFCLTLKATGSFPWRAPLWVGLKPGACTGELGR